MTGVFGSMNYKHMNTFFVEDTVIFSQQLKFMMARLFIFKQKGYSQQGL